MKNQIKATTTTTITLRRTLRSGQRGLVWLAIAAAAVIAGCKSRPVAPPQPGAPPPAASVGAPTGLSAVRSMAEYRRRAAELILAANSGGTYAGPVSEPAYGIVVMNVALNSDGSIKSTSFLRRSAVGPDANDLAMQAVRRVGSFGPVSNLGGPWEFSETFFYNDARKFQLRTVVEKL